MSATANVPLDDSSARRRAAPASSLHALHVVEYALSAPNPRRRRTWLHRVATAVDALACALDQQIHVEANSIGPLCEIALCAPRYATRITRLRQEQHDLRVAVASIREHIDEHSDLPIDTADIRDRLAAVANRYRHHLADEADLIYDATGININAAQAP